HGQPSINRSIPSSCNCLKTLERTLRWQPPPAERPREPHPRTAFVCGASSSSEERAAWHVERQVGPLSEVNPGIRTRKRGFLDGQASGRFWREVKACQGVRLFSPW